MSSSSFSLLALGINIMASSLANNVWRIFYLFKNNFHIWFIPTKCGLLL